jgi:hypothetical protein
MKHKYYLLLFLLAMIFSTAGHTQDKVTAIDALVVDLWPDYDRTSVLVLLTGTLSADTKLPATVILPLPETAQLNAVARIDSSDGIMKDDIFSSPAPGELRLTTPDLRFRVEYYLPYSVNNNRRTFNFAWLADVSVNRFKLRVQQPISASFLATEPATINVLEGQDGFTYYTYPEQAVPAWQPLLVRVDYTMTTAQLSVESLAPPSTGVQKPGLPSTSKTGAGINWSIVAVVAGGVIIVTIFVWQIATRRDGSSRSVTQDAKVQKQSQAKYCRNCDNQMDKDDRFCRNCGTALKGE